MLVKSCILRLCIYDIVMKICKWFEVCPMNFYNRRGLVSDSVVNYYCKGGNWLECERYKKEEAHIPHPDNLLPDGTIDESLI